MNSWYSSALQLSLMQLYKLLYCKFSYISHFSLLLTRENHKHTAAVQQQAVEFHTCGVLGNETSGPFQS